MAKQLTIQGETEGPVTVDTCRHELMIIERMKMKTATNRVVSPRVLYKF